MKLMPGLPAPIFVSADANLLAAARPRGWRSKTQTSTNSGTTNDEGRKTNLGSEGGGLVSEVAVETMIVIVAAVMDACHPQSRTT